MLNRYPLIIFYRVNLFYFLNVLLVYLSGKLDIFIKFTVGWLCLLSLECLIRFLPIVSCHMNKACPGRGGSLWNHNMVIVWQWIIVAAFCITSSQALTVYQFLFSPAWKGSNPCKYGLQNKALQKGKSLPSRRLEVSNLTFNLTNKKHESSRISLQRQAPVICQIFVSLKKMWEGLIDTTACDFRCRIKNWVWSLQGECLGYVSKVLHPESALLNKLQLAFLNIWIIQSMLMDDSS